VRLGLVSSFAEPVFPGSRQATPMALQARAPVAVEGYTVYRQARCINSSGRPAPEGGRSCCFDPSLGVVIGPAKIARRICGHQPTTYVNNFLLTLGDPRPFSLEARQQRTFAPAFTQN
jgi:hypothetical protein